MACPTSNSQRISFIGPGLSALRSMQRPPPPQRSSAPALFRVAPACNASLFRPGFALDTFFAQLAAGALRPRVLSSAPWLLQLDDFTPMSVAAGMLEQAGRFRTSFVNTPDGYRISSYRNASQWGCVRCGSRSGQSAFATYVDRVHQALGLPHRQSSDLVVLRYGAGGYYRRHHDYLAPRSQPGLWRDRGPRRRRRRQSRRWRRGRCHRRATAIAAAHT